MNEPRTSTISWRIPALSLSILVAAPLLAQQPLPTARPDAAAPQSQVAPPPGLQHEAPPVTVRNITMDTDLDDEPDFVRATDVLDADGNIVAIKKIGNPYTLSFTNGEFEPPRGVDPALRVKLYSAPNASTFGFIMIRGRMSSFKLDRIAKTGVKLLDAHTFQSMKAWIPQSALPALEALPFVHWVGYARTHQKLDHNFVPVLAAAKDEDLLPVIVNPFVPDVGPESKRVQTSERVIDRFTTVNGEGAPASEVIPNGPAHKALVGEFGFRFENYNEIIHNFEGKMRKRDVLRLLEQDWVHTVELFEGLPTEDHDQMIPMVKQDLVRKTYDGRGVAAGFIDSGIDSTPWHRDFGGIFYVYWGNAITPLSDHGTHVAGTIWGNGNANNRYEGGAPGAGRGGANNRLFFSRNDRALSSNASSFGASYTDSNNVISPYPRVISNSYSWKQAAGYYGSEANARTIDQASYDKRQLWCFSAGNKQTTANDWCGSPSSGKNVLTCGALMDTSTPGYRPSWSRWGVLDFRTKPDVSAPGDVGTSTLWNSTDGYTNMSGTSMSTPLLSSTMITRIHADSWYADKPEALRARAVASAKNQNRLSSGEFLAPQTGATTRQTTGWGLINSQNMIFGSAQSTGWTYAGTYTGSGQGWTSAEITLPSDTQNVRMVLVITEPAASSSATQARRNDVRAYLDVFPYTAGNNTGDFTVASSLQTVIVYNSIAMASLDKRVKLKTYAQSIVASQARWALCMYVYRKNPTVVPTLSVSGPTLMKPSANADFTTTLSSGSTYDQFRGGRLALNDSGFTMNSMRRDTEVPYTQWYYPTNLHPSYPHPRVTSGSSYGMTVGSGTSRPLVWNLKAPAVSGSYTMTAYGLYQSGITTTTTLTRDHTVCVDGINPLTAVGLQSTTHTPNTWSNATTLSAAWGIGTDSGCAGIRGYAVTLTSGAPASPTAFTTTLRTRSFTVTNNSAGYYVNLKNVDRNDNLSTSNSAIGPFRIDTTVPSLTSVVINRGATHTSSPNVSVQIAATDTFSGVAEMRFSGDNATWTRWSAYSTSAQSLSMGSLGWTSEGTRFAYVQVRDQAGNVARTMTDSIIWLNAPQISAAPIASLPNVTRGFYRLTGSDFVGVNRVDFGGTSITAQWTNNNDDWWNTGAYLVVSDSELRVYPPQGSAPGAVAVRAHNAVFAGNAFNVTVTAQPGRVLHANENMTAGKTLSILMAQSSSEPATTQGLLVVSPVKIPSVAPGIVSLEIGAGFTAYLPLIQTSFNATTRCIHLNLPTLASYSGTSVYIEGVYMRNPLPLPTTNSWLIKVQ